MFSQLRTFSNFVCFRFNICQSCKKWKQMWHDVGRQCRNKPGVNGNFKNIKSIKSGLVSGVFSTFCSLLQIAIEEKKIPGCIPCLLYAFDMGIHFSHCSLILVKRVQNFLCLYFTYASLCSVKMTRIIKLLSH